ncbi:MAG: hypothetical protein IKK83_07110 [Clostridia bacterium]|nr:hypothetical protein [Clostridia bacterium]
MALCKEQLGGMALAFGAGALLCAVLPCGAMLFVQGVLLLGTGALLFCCR